MEKPRPSTIAWTGIVAGVAAYDILCPANEMMSQRADSWMEHPIKGKLFTLAVGALALHLTNAIDPKYDVFNYLLKAKE